MIKSRVQKNVIYAAALQITNTICGFILPRLLIKSFGAEVYGLTASITQFMGYVSLLEGGVSGVILASLYKPLADHDEEKISQIISTVRSFFVRIGLVFVFYTLFLSVSYPYFRYTGYPKRYIFALVVVISIRLLAQYFLAMTYRLLLIADEKGYIVSAGQIITAWVNLAFAIMAISLFNDIIWVKLFSGIAYLVQPIVFGLYVNKYYSIEKKASKDSELIAQRWDGFGQNLAYFIHTNTDVVILTFFSSLDSITVYSIYLLIAGALKSIVAVVSSAVAPSVGTVLARDNIEKSRAIFDVYEYAVELLTFVLFSCGIVLLIPFVKIYTNGMNDAEYIQPLFGILLLLAEMVYCIRDPYVSVAYAKGHFKQTKKYAYGEAIINILISLILVKWLDLVGVALGTLVSMSIRMLQQVYYLKKNILFRPIRLFVKRMVFMGLAGFFTIIVSYNSIPLEGNSFIQWIRDAIFVGLISTTAFGIISLTAFRVDVMALVKRKVN